MAEPIKTGDTKRCPQCGRDLPRAETHYYLEPRYKPGKGVVGTRWSSWCKTCARERNRRYWREEYYPAHAEEHIAAVQERRKARKAKKEG